MDKSAEDLNLQPTMQDRDGFKVVGCAGEFVPGATQDIGALWSHFAPRIAEVQGRVGSATYGVCCVPEEGMADSGRFTYIAGVEAAELEVIPEGMTGIELAAKRYAVFAHERGLGPELPKTLQYIFAHWLPASDYQPDGWDFEYYDDQFDPMTGTGTFYIYVPVKPK